MSLLLLALPNAAAFCGTFVAAPGASLTNHSSQVIIGRSGTSTTLTLAADYTGDAADFAVVLPIPEVVGPEDVTTGDASLVQWIADYSTPRGVAYTCDDVFDLQQGGLGCGTQLGCSEQSLSAADMAGQYGELADDSVTVEASFTSGTYDIVVLSAEESSDLFGWLRDNGYELPRGGDEILQEYIDAGVYFLAARLSLSAAPSANTWLPPLRITYEADTFGLPIRIGTISADGEQEVLVYTLTPVEDGEVGISNYPEVTLDDECMWKPEPGEDMGDWYGRQVAEAVDAVGAGWVKEYSADLVPTAGTGYHCDPCTAEPAIPGGTFQPFGIEGDSAHLTRLRVRYTPETATSDLSLYVSGIAGASSQLRYIKYLHDLEYLYPVCGEGWSDEPGECANEYQVGCDTNSVRAGGLGILLTLTLLRRRRA